MFHFIYWMKDLFLKTVFYTITCYLAPKNWSHYEKCKIIGKRLKVFKTHLGLIDFMVDSNWTKLGCAKPRHCKCGIS